MSTRIVRECLNRDDILDLVTDRGCCKAIIEAFDLEVGPEAAGAATALCAHPAILETLQPALVAGRFSIFAADPIEILDVEAGNGEPLAVLVQRVRESPILEDYDHEIPFVGGWIGYIAYEAGVPAYLVDAREGMRDLPSLRFGLYDHALVFDHHKGRWWGVAIDWTGCHISRSAVSVRLKALQERLEKARRLVLPQPIGPVDSVVLETMTREQYDRRVNRIRQYIEAGDIYQVNLAQKFTVRTQYTPYEFYRRIRKVNPSAYAAFLSWDDCAILSASPELFLELRGNRVVTRPIKGTRPRVGIESVDAASQNLLSASEKERSELNMIIDLLRNDLGRVCAYGTVRVTDTGSVEAHPTVFHRVATIEGRLAEGTNWADLLKAAFPGGSIVGAPKIRAMQIIRELEPFQRGPYCGAIGWIGLDGNMTLNVAIRTMTWRSGVVDLFAGGAIVAESDADSEYQEILAKAAGMLASLGVGRESTLESKESVRRE